MWFLKEKNVIMNKKSNTYWTNFFYKSINTVIYYIDMTFSILSKLMGN
jgi:hypothetical protein